MEEASYVAVADWRHQAGKEGLFDEQEAGDTRGGRSGAFLN